MENKNEEFNKETLFFLMRDLISRKKREIKEYQNLVSYVKNDEDFVLKEIEFMQQQIKKIENILSQESVILDIENLEEIVFVLDEIIQDDRLKKWCLSLRF